MTEMNLFQEQASKCSFRYYSALAQPFLRRFKEHRVRFAEDAGNIFGERAVFECFGEIEFLDLAGIFTRKPMIALAEQVVTHLRPRSEEHTAELQSPCK